MLATMTTDTVVFSSSVTIGDDDYFARMLKEGM
jgi:hypothetical protein